MNLSVTDHPVGGYVGGVDSETWLDALNLIPVDA